MDILIFLLIICFLVFAGVFFRDIFPKCPLCGRTGLWLFYRRPRSIPDYSNTPPVCKKCARKYEVETPSRYSEILKVKSKVELRVKNRKMN